MTGSLKTDETEVHLVGEVTCSQSHNVRIKTRRKSLGLPAKDVFLYHSASQGSTLSFFKPLKSDGISFFPSDLMDLNK